MRALSLVALIVANCLPAAALDFSSLLSRAVTLDRASVALSRETALAEARWHRASLAASALRFDAQTGAASARVTTDGSAAVSVSAEPSAGVSATDGTRFSVKAPIQWSPDGTSAGPEVAGELPLVRGAIQPLVALAEAEAALTQARRAQEDRRLDVEALLVEKLRALARAQLRVYQGRQAVLAATVARQRAEKVDGAVPGGTAWETKDRGVRLASRDLRRAEADVQGLRAELALLAGMGEQDTAEAPARPDAGASLPEIDRTLGVLKARADLRLARFKAAEADRTSTLFLGWGLGYQVAPTDQGPTARTGLKAGWDDFSLEGGVDWKSAGPGLTLSFRWQPRPAGDRKWEAVTDNLILEGFAAAVEASREQAALQLSNLETRRRDLRAATEEAEADAKYAQEQAALYQVWSEKGLVTPQEKEEVENAVLDARTAQDLVILDWQTWDVDRRRLGAPEGK